MGGSRAHLLVVVLIMLGIVVLVPMLLRLDSVHETTRISTDHLEITAYVRDAAAASLSLVLDIAPRDRIRVYAPGAAVYHAIAVTVAPTPFLQFQPPTCSTPERLHLPGTTTASRSIDSRSV